MGFSSFLPAADPAGASACGQQAALPPQLSGKRSLTGGQGSAEGAADSEEAEAKRSRLQPEEMPTAPVRRTGKLVSGRTCVECGATQTPQWREGPAGPKTLCNACGVRYVRAQQRANKRAVSMGSSRPSGGYGGRQSRASKVGCKGLGGVGCGWRAALGPVQADQPFGSGSLGPLVCCCPNLQSARAEPACGPRGGARAAASAAAVEEVPQRPLRQVGRRLGFARVMQVLDTERLETGRSRA